MSEFKKFKERGTWTFTVHNVGDIVATEIFSGCEINWSSFQLPTGGTFYKLKKKNVNYEEIKRVYTIRLKQQDIDKMAEK